jgi:carbamoyltransferase
MHDPSACIIKNGVLIAAAEEERFTRVKHAEVTFPINSIKYCLKKAEIQPHDLSAIAIPYEPALYRRKDIARWAFSISNNLLRKPIEAAYYLALHQYAMITKERRINKKLGPGFEKIPIHYVNHHLSHASSAFNCAGLKNALTIAADGAGDRYSSVMYDCNNNFLNPFFEKEADSSIGLIYTFMTQLLGFRRLDGESKVMGLAAYGKHDKRLSEALKKILRPTKEGYYSLRAASFKQIKPILDELFPGVKPLTFQPPQYNANIAHALQSALENIMANLANIGHNETGNKNICLSGGVALNCKMNGELLKLDWLDEIFIQPASNDAGLAIGAAFKVYNDLGYKSNYLMKDVYLGPEYSDQQIIKALKDNEISFEAHGDIAGEAAYLLSKGKIIAWFQGRMELGPRALGNRSLLANPCIKGMNDKVNEIKRREKWRPFCPSMTYENKDEFLINSRYAPFMILSFSTSQNAIKTMPAVIHIDGSTRPQTLRREINPLYYELLRKFEGETGMPVLLNTSMNLKGEPIICTPKEAIEFYLKTKIDALCLNDYLIKR